MKEPSPRRFPTTLEQFDDFDGFFSDHVLFGLKPNDPMFLKTDTTVSMGSCFAKNINDALTKFDVRTNVHFDIAETNNSVFAIYKMIEIITKPDVTPKDEKWLSAFLRGLSRDAARRYLSEAKCIILTLGVSIYMVDADGYPAPGNIKTVKQIGPDTTADFLIKIQNLIKKANPDAKIILTVSPIPLAASPFEDKNAFALDCVSKSFLRSGVELALIRETGDLYYWPSFEAIRWFFGHSTWKFGDGDGHPRHVDPRLIEKITDKFIALYYSEG